MSTWNPDTTVLMKSELVIPDQTNSIHLSNFGSEIIPHPNPTSGILRLPNSGIHHSYIELFNINGETVHKAEYADQINISNLPSGIYYGIISDNANPIHFFKILKID